MCFTQLKEDLANNLYSTEKDVIDSVNLIFCNAKAYNEDSSEWFQHADYLQNYFNSMYGELETERNLIKVDDNDAIIFTEFNEELLKAIIEKADFKHSGVVEKEALCSLAKEAAEALEKQPEADLKETILNLHRDIVLKQKLSLQTTAPSVNDTEENREENQSPRERECFYVVVALNHALRELRLDRDIVNVSNAERARLLILEYRSDISKISKAKQLWLESFAKGGSCHGCEKEDIWPSDEEELGFVNTVSGLMQKSHDYYAQEKKSDNFRRIN